MSKSKSKSSAVAEEKALAQGVKPLPDEQDPKGNRTASGTFARSNRANSASGEVFEQHSVSGAVLTTPGSFSAWLSVGSLRGCVYVKL